MSMMHDGQMYFGFSEFGMLKIWSLIQQNPRRHATFSKVYGKQSFDTEQ